MKRLFLIACLLSPGLALTQTPPPAPASAQDVIDGTATYKFISPKVAADVGLAPSTNGVTLQQVTNVVNNNNAATATTAISATVAAYTTNILIIRSNSPALSFSNNLTAAVSNMVRFDVLKIPAGNYPLGTNTIAPPNDTIVEGVGRGTRIYGYGYGPLYTAPTNNGTLRNVLLDWDFEPLQARIVDTADDSLHQSIGVPTAAAANADGRLGYSVRSVTNLLIDSVAIRAQADAFSMGTNRNVNWTARNCWIEYTWDMLVTGINSPTNWMNFENCTFVYLPQVFTNQAGDWLSTTPRLVRGSSGDNINFNNCSGTQVGCAAGTLWDTGTSAVHGGNWLVSPTITPFNFSPGELRSGTLSVNGVQYTIGGLKLPAASYLSVSNTTASRVAMLDAAKQLTNATASGTSILRADGTAVTVGSGLSDNGTTLSATGTGGDPNAITNGYTSPWFKNTIVISNGTSASRIEWYSDDGVDAVTASSGFDPDGVLSGGTAGWYFDTSYPLVGVGSGLTALNGSSISSGTVAAARLGSGSSITTKFLRGDNTWQTVSGGTGFWIEDTDNGGWTNLYGARWTDDTGGVYSLRFGPNSETMIRNGVSQFANGFYVDDETNPDEFFVGDVSLATAPGDFNLNDGVVSDLTATGTITATNHNYRWSVTTPTLTEQGAATRSDGTNLYAVFRDAGGASTEKRIVTAYENGGQLVGYINATTWTAAAPRYIGAGTGLTSTYEPGTRPRVAAGRYGNLMVQIANAVSAGTNVTVTVVTNGVASNLSVSLNGDASGNQFGLNNTTTLDLTNGSTMSWRISTDNASGINPLVWVTLERTVP